MRAEDKDDQNLPAYFNVAKITRRKRIVLIIFFVLTILGSAYILSNYLNNSEVNIITGTLIVIPYTVFTLTMGLLFTHYIENRVMFQRKEYLKNWMKSHLREFEVSFSESDLWFMSHVTKKEPCRLHGVEKGDFIYYFETASNCLLLRTRKLI